MPKKEIKAKNVVSYSTGEIREQVTAAPKTTPKPVKVKIEKTVKAKKVVEEDAPKENVPKEILIEETVSEEVPQRPAPQPEAIETRPLNLRTSRYIDEKPQDLDWTAEDDREEVLEDEESISPFAEIFIPLHNDSTGTVVRKGMVIVSCIVILCCLIAMVMKNGAISGTISPDLPTLANQTAAAVSAVLSNL